MFFAAKGGEALYSQQKQDRELTVAQIMNSLLPIQTQIEESRENPLDNSAMTEIKSLMIIHTVEMRNRFKGLDLTDRVPEELWTEVCDIV